MMVSVMCVCVRADEVSYRCFGQHCTYRLLILNLPLDLRRHVWEAGSVDRHHVQVHKSGQRRGEPERKGGREGREFNGLGLILVLERLLKPPPLHSRQLSCCRSAPQTTTDRSSSGKLCSPPDSHIEQTNKDSAQHGNITDPKSLGPITPLNLYHRRCDQSKQNSNNEDQ